MFQQEVSTDELAHQSILKVRDTDMTFSPGAIEIDSFSYDVFT